MVAREQLEFVKRLVARFAKRENVAAPIDIAQAQYISIIALLRSIGHVFEKVDCDTDAKKVWARQAWSRWKREPIFCDFIEPTRNQLLKEFRGNLNIENDAFGQIIVSTDHASPNFVGKYGWLDADKILDAEGDRMMPKIRGAIEFWERSLHEADAAFRELST